MAESLRLYGYWRSSSSWRVRIALALKGLDYEAVPVHLIRGGGEQLSPEHRERNPQALVPVLEHGDFRLSQSLAICEYLDSLAPEPRLLPSEPRAAAQCRSLCQLIACEIQPLNNLRVLRYLESELGADKSQQAIWYRHWIRLGFAALESVLAKDNSPHALGSEPGLLDLMLVPQLYNARRFDCELSPYPRLLALEEAALALPAFANTAPEQQPEAER
ncbi:MAG: maleylacetoacetate isomerase [Oceanococcaceae bacterium]